MIDREAAAVVVDLDKLVQGDIALLVVSVELERIIEIADLREAERRSFHRNSARSKHRTLGLRGNYPKNNVFLVGT